MVKLISEGTVPSGDDYLVFYIDLKYNGISPLREDWDFVGNTININGKEYKCIGVEAFAAGSGYLHSKIGLLVK